MSVSILKQIGDAQKKKAVVDVRSGDTVKVTQKIKEGDKSRLQTFEGVVIRVDRKDSHTARIVVRKVTSGVGVEKSYLIHSPLVEKIEITKRAKVRRNNLSYLRQRSGKSARLKGRDFDRAAVNDVSVPEELELPEASVTVREPKAEEAVGTEEVKNDGPELELPEASDAPKEVEVEDKVTETSGEDKAADDEKEAETEEKTDDAKETDDAKAE